MVDVGVNDMSIKKSSKAKHYKNKTANILPHKQLSTIIDQTPILNEYVEVLEFIIKVNLQKSKDNNVCLTGSARKTIEDAAKQYVLIAQLSHITPQEIKHKITQLSQRNRSHANWKADIDLEVKYNVMAGLATK